MATDLDLYTRGLPRPRTRMPALTARELVILSRLPGDRTLGQIATELFVTRNTVKSQVRSVYRKLGVSTRTEAVLRAREYGLG